LKIYYAKISGLTEEDFISARNLLPRERLKKIEKIKQKKSQYQSVSAGLLLEYALQEKGLTGRELTFLVNKDGKPYIAECPDFHYSLSHSGEFVALAIEATPVGIDIEGLRAGYQKLANRFFSEEEIAFLQNNWSDSLFTKLWTRKESYLKATGYGMRMPLEGFSVVDDRVLLNEKMYEEMLEEGDEYYLKSIQIEDSYWLSVCRKNEVVITELTDLALVKVDLKKMLEKV